MAVINIASERKRLGLNQKEFAEKIGVSLTTVSNWETGTTDVGANNLCAMSKLFGCSTDYLLGISDERLNISRQS